MQIYRDVIDYFYNHFVVFKMFQDDTIYKFLNVDKYDNIEDIYKYFENKENKEKIDEMFNNRFNKVKEKYKEEFKETFSVDFLLEYLKYFDVEKVNIVQGINGKLYEKDSTRFALLVYSLLMLYKLSLPFYDSYFSYEMMKKSGELVSEYSVYALNVKLDGSTSLEEIKKYFNLPAYEMRYGGLSDDFVEKFILNKVYYFKVPIDLFVSGIFNDFAHIEAGHNDFALRKGENYDNKINSSFYKGYFLAAQNGYKFSKDYKYKPKGCVINGITTYKKLAGFGGSVKEYDYFFETGLLELFGDLLFRNIGYMVKKPSSKKIRFLNLDIVPSHYDVVGKSGVIGHFINDECIRKNSSDQNSEIIWSKDILKLSGIKELQEKYSSID